MSETSEAATIVQQVLFNTQDSQGRAIASDTMRTAQIVGALKKRKLLTTVTAADLLAKLKEAIDEHDPDSWSMQWYTDEYAIDCDADEFWTVIRKVLEEVLS